MNIGLQDDSQEEAAMVFLRNCWYVAGWSQHFPASQPVARTILGESIVLYRIENGSVAAYGLLLLGLSQRELRDRGAISGTIRALRAGLRRGQCDDRGAATGHLANA